jgi:uncharacterized protein (TIGR02996 family)
MKHEDAFLQDICAHPDDTAPRLVYADWLDDHGGAAGQDRAEFIRLQCDLDRIEPEERPANLVDREADLLEQHRNLWLRPLKKIGVNVEFVRGFPEKINLTADKFVATADQLFARAPIRTLRLTRVRDRWTELLACPHLGRVRGLDLHDARIGIARALELADCKALSGIREFNLDFNAVKTRGFTALMRSPHLTGLTGLSVRHNVLDDEACRELARAPWLTQLQRLSLANNPITSAGLAALLPSGNRIALTELSLGGTREGDLLARVLAACPGVHHLRKLDLAETDITDEGARALASAAHLGSLTSLCLKGCLLTQEGFEVLVRSPHLKNLTSLIIVGNQARLAIGVLAPGADGTVPWPRLRELVLAYSLDLSELRAALAPPERAYLTRLELTGSRAGLGVGQVIAEATHLTGLRRLHLSACGLECRGVEALASAPHLRHLRFLNLESNQIRAPGARALIDSPYLEYLLGLNLMVNPQISAPERQALIERFGRTVAHVW